LVPRHEFTLRKKLGSTRSIAKRWKRPLIPTYAVRTAPASTPNASIATRTSSQRPPLSRPMYDRSVDWLATIVSTGTTARANSEYSTLNVLESAHMLRSVLGNTPAACSSTYCDELSKPVTPSIAVP